MKKGWILAGILCWATHLAASDEEGRLSMFVVGCFTPEFQDIYNGDLDGYLLIGNLNSRVDGSYLPRNYDNDNPDLDCDLPVQYDKKAGPFDVLAGTFFEFRFLVDNTSTFGGGPLTAPGTVVRIAYPEGLIPYSATRNCVDDGQELRCNLGTVAAFGMAGVSVRFYAAQVGSYRLEGRVSSSLVDPNPANNSASAEFDVVPPQTHLVYPWISKNENFASIVVANNVGDDEALVWLSAVRRDGDFHSRALVIPPHGFLRDTTENLFPDLGEGSGYSIRLISASSQIHGRWVTYDLAAASGNSPSQGVAVNLLDPSLQNKELAGTRIIYGYLPISQTVISAPVVINAGTDEADVTMDFYDENGNLVLTDNQTLAGLSSYRPFASVANNLVPQGSGNVQMIATSPSNTITGVGFTFNNSGEPSIGNVTRLEEGGNGTHLVLPWVSNNQDFESVVVVNNYGETAAQVTLTARRRLGEPETAMRQIPASGFLNETASSLFQSLGQGGGYTVEVTSANNALTGQWVTNTLTTASLGSPSQGVGVNLNLADSPRFGNEILFGFLPLSEGFTSAPVVVNVGDQATDVTLRFYDEAGNLLTEDADTLAGLEPLRPFATVANNLVAPGSGDVYMTATSDGQPITGVAFVFNGVGEPAIGNVSRIAVGR